ncbi:hypothetical protein A3A46_01490 [Candidatus Roizmanbacteria bacterium RIFCSPLOWO2_01_FULL_37_13]|uniref:Glycosyl transferase family 1 domain-containing protein n=1 Tax=Candidatus Roizmanbacteria bacterium RIFCSPHIGHO2_02_FULL_38_11 TaxID=1802039 RepID=A0A1F7H0K6_9BACT|nr:MAG: hypothetical protein A3C25_01790 [Candidatus Roizmanbacteria bacterium RIFCSPHIGHO2_02_FULL_38_11]OGK42542.1 MAG: hypothetical protein A3A46_01490 [Candidatus Roizmanbacteria bacterium RIFCSPLOWO2_01_FULL_37_13]
MNILWFTWKDKKNPQAGGAELINEEFAKRLVEDGHQLKFLVAGYKGAKKKETRNGYDIIRVGNRYTVYWKAFRYFRKHLQSWPDLIIEEVNTIPFFTQLYTSSLSVTPSEARNLKNKPQRILLIYQLCREIWFYQFPFPLSLIGYLLEPIYLKFLNKNKVITESESTKKDLLKYGFKKENIFIFPVGINIRRFRKLAKSLEFTLLSFGSIRSMKRTHHQVEAFEIAKKQIPQLKLIVAGDSNNSYGHKVIRVINSSLYKKDITYLERVDEKRKSQLMEHCHLLLATPVKEGWGLVITEANSKGTPAIVYNVDGLRDSVKNNITGLVCRDNTPDDMAKNIIRAFKDKFLYKRLQRNALNFSKSFTFDRSYKEFKKILRL